MSDHKLEANSIIEKILNERAQKDKFEDILKENAEEYKKCVNGIASTPNGQYVLKILRNACGMDSYQRKLDPAGLIEENGKRSIWIEMFHNHLTPESKELIK